MKKLIQLLALGATVFMTTGCSQPNKISEEEFYAKCLAHEVHQYSKATITSKENMVIKHNEQKSTSKRNDKNLFVWNSRNKEWDHKEGPSAYDRHYLNYVKFWDLDPLLSLFGEPERGVSVTITYYSDLSARAKYKGEVELDTYDSFENTVHHYGKCDYEYFYKFDKYGYLIEFTHKGSRYINDVAKGPRPWSNESSSKGYSSIYISYKD